LLYLLDELIVKCPEFLVFGVLKKIQSGRPRGG